MDTDNYSATKISCIVPRLFPSLGPALLISMGYIDPGKWAAAVEGGARFGFDLVLLVLAFNCSAIFCQYISACVAVVTGKNLAQICSEEYNRPTCILLGVQAELSVIALELNMILGISYGLNLLFGLDMFICILLSASDAVLFPFLTALMDKCKTEMLFISAAGLALSFYVIGILTNQPEIPLIVDEIFPRLKGESAYTLMSLLGASIMPHNFYLHSSIVQQQQQWQRLRSISTGTFCHEHLFAIMCIFSVIFLVNLVVMLSAATVFHSAGLPVSFQDIPFLLDQILRSPMAPFAFFLVLFFSSQVTTLTWNIGAQVLVHDFFEITPPVWIHRATIKSLAIVPALFCAWNSGAEGIYQLLIFSQVILALLLPSSVIPLFRVASSGLIMGVFKLSHFMEILALLVFLGMLALNIFFILEILFGDADWIGWNVGNSTTIPYMIILIAACASFSLMLWLAATPLSSARVSPGMQIFNLASQKELPEPSECTEENELNVVHYDGDNDPRAEHAAMDKSVLSSENYVLESEVDLPETIKDSDPDHPNQSADVENYARSTSHTKESTSPVEQVPIPAGVDDVSADGLLGETTSQKVEPNDILAKTGMEVEVHTAGKDDDEVDVWEPDESPEGIAGSMSTSTYEGPGSFKNASGKSDDGCSGSLSRLSGLGRAARRTLAAVLDEFWGHLFDFHGQVTQDAKSKGIDVILGLELKPVVCTVKTDVAGTEYATQDFSEVERGSIFLTRSRDYDSPRQQRMSNLESSFGIQTGVPSWSSYIQSLDACVQNSRSNQLNANEKRYSSLRLPSYSNERDYQPATIHGCQMASYYRRIDADRNADSLGIPLDPSTPKSTSHVPNYRNSLTSSSGQNGFASVNMSSIQNPSLPMVSKLQVEGPYYNASLVGTGGDSGPSAYTKKYHSLPDISGLTVYNRNSYLADRNTQWSNPIGPGPSASRLPYEQSTYLPASSRAEGLPLPFDELSPSKHYRDPFSMPLSSNLDTKSLWSRQPFEQLFGVAGRPRNVGREGVVQKPVSHSDSEAKLLQAFKSCVLKLLKLEGSDWLFRQNGGIDEDLIERVAATEGLLYEAEGNEVNWVHLVDSPYISSDGKFWLRNEEACHASCKVSLVPNCGEGCVWQVGLIVSFGVWCVRRILELSLMESRPELWGKYTYVLNRLQGILDPAFFKIRPPISTCLCLQIPSTLAGRSGLPLPNGLSPATGKATRGRFTSAGMLLDLIKDVEASVSSRKGRTGTAAGDVAFPKGKENLASVLKRYKRRLSNKSVGAHDGAPGSRKAPMPTTSFMQ
ncbi:hypothetical protein MRB53_004188 [Persea americana]|uniref:Uncharacterized protein n=1 Tax=Persea americana TaxID=3435 RepID=A0ACC2MZV0_PERAE|nr:hypothetical protein MRB53_004188 [Persea americana]|eukprot:TRINITY_DN14011_c0_g1_i1.p1 TRINITY_DN14011_c0_g1~~TRINITY_DN14011_c0_g1_i1.p1  ORF type:complete len:1293 (-),score=277.51 TRINITY_DN14011_c0_g1_i1:786-4664(-)